MEQKTKDQLRTIFSIKPSLVAKSLDGASPSETIPILNLLEMDLTNVGDVISNEPEIKDYTFGYGEQLKSLSQYGKAGDNKDPQNRNELAKVKKRDGEIIDNKYQILGPLGAGGASEVYLAQRLLMGDKVALKLLRSSYARDPDTARRFHLEAVTTASIKHPNVITVHDFDFTDNGTPYIVMELLKGETLLGEQQRVGRIALRRAIQIITPICAALNVAHSQGIIHRDLKPANIVLHKTSDDSEVIKLIDFGIAKQLTGNDFNNMKTLPGLVVGTPAYMSPERCMEEPYDLRTDIYNLGLIFYEIIAGRHPFQAKTMMAMMANQISNMPPPLHNVITDVSTAVENVIFKALAKSPNDRYSTAQEFADELNSAYYASWLQ
ncbi:MAG: serine/threonine protein kinase [Acidobacteria bacterium]|nr:serine/threonine protein kinase [Acidobacteriota bacterium]